MLLPFEAHQMSLMQIDADRFTFSGGGINQASEIYDVYVFDRAQPGESECVK